MRANNKVRLAAYNKIYFAKNKDKIYTTAKKWRVKNKDKLTGYKKKYIKKKMETDPLFKLRMSLWRRVKETLKRYSNSGKVCSSKQYGINYKMIIEFLGKPPAAAFEVHHIIPLCCFDFNNLKAIERAFAPENHTYTEIEEHKAIHRELMKYGVQPLKPKD